ncbi:hypothetical protein [Thermoflavimicrobium dichotomicum]|uniref:Uncharacterized protein n=1 Tax=Thermoflavimicrobium dichotomicum TaxID=46223 RepID=A0A1I3K4P7_9BACL|nr:hypothetical protein [Thermoflavimicrobium dichotomicum]SFI67477.1 hypothetical protein SAMN05421852_101331 [Thermoflavimicrobium dichotomicum]
MNKNRKMKKTHWFLTVKYVPVFILALAIIWVIYIGFANSGKLSSQPAISLAENTQERIASFERQMDNANFILTALGIIVTVSGFVLTFYGYFQAIKFKEIIEEEGEKYNQKVEELFKKHKQRIDQQFNQLNDQLQHEFNERVNNVIEAIQILTAPVIAESKEFRSLEKRLNQAKQRCPEIWDKYFLALFNWNQHLKRDQIALPTRKYAEYAFRYMERHLKEHHYHKEAWLMLIRWYNQEDQDVRAVDTLRRFLEKDPEHVYLVEKEVTNWDIQQEDVLEWKEQLIKEAKKKAEDPLRHAYKILQDEDIKQENQAIKQAIRIINKYQYLLEREKLKAGENNLQDDAITNLKQELLKVDDEDSKMDKTKHEDSHN